MAADIDLGQHLEDYMEGLVRAGRYESRDAVLKEGLRLLELRDRQKAELDAALARGLAEAKAGLGTPIEDVMAELESRYQATAKERRA